MLLSIQVEIKALVDDNSERTAQVIFLGFSNYGQGWAHFGEALWWQTLCQLFWNHVIGII